jgi:hypothetical protein
MSNVIVVIGAGQIGQAIARRVGAGKHVLLADVRADNSNVAAEVLGNAGYDVSRRADKYHQSWHHHHSARQGRTERATWRRLLPYDRGVGGWTRRHSRRGGKCRRAAYGAGRWIHHRQRLPYGRRSDRRLLVGRARTQVSEQR